MKIESQCIHEGYHPKDGEPQVMPIYQSTTFRYHSTEDIGKLFDLQMAGHFYSRLSNPTVDFVEKKIAALEGGVGAMCTSSGQAASFMAVANIAKSGDHILSCATLYGGTINLLAVTLKRFGIDCTFVQPDATEEEIQKEIKPNTRCIFGETLSNPNLAVFDIEKFAKIAHANDIPLIVDNTFPTPILCRPIEYGADIVVHSTTKYMDGHAVQLGGVVVDSGKFNWANGKFPEFTTPDESYHGLVYADAFKESAYIVKARVQLMRDLGFCTTAINAFYLNLGLETLPLRIRQHSENAKAIAEFLTTCDCVESVNYPTLEGNKYKELAEKYLPEGCAGVISVVFKGGKEAAAKFSDSLKLASIAVHVADLRTSILHPASSTHRQLTDEQLQETGILPGLVRLSVGIENKEDLIEDIKQAMAQI